MIDADTVKAFQRDGAVCLRQLFRPEEIAMLRAGIDENLAHLSPRAKLASGADDPGKFVEDFFLNLPIDPRTIAERGLLGTDGSGEIPTVLLSQTPDDKLDPIRQTQDVVVSFGTDQDRADETEIRGRRLLRALPQLVLDRRTPV